MVNRNGPYSNPTETHSPADLHFTDDHSTVVMDPTFSSRLTEFNVVWTIPSSVAF